MSLMFRIPSKGIFLFVGSLVLTMKTATMRKSNVRVIEIKKTFKFLIIYLFD